MFTNDEVNLMCIYGTGTRKGLIAELTQMRDHLGTEETGLQALTDSALKKLRNLSDVEYAALDLFPDFVAEVINGARHSESSKENPTQVSRHPAGTGVDRTKDETARHPEHGGISP